MVQFDECEDEWRGMEGVEYVIIADKAALAFVL
jgi:hypothetical protein